MMSWWFTEQDDVLLNRIKELQQEVIDLEKKYYNEDNNLDLSQCTRVEVIDEEGRSYVKWKDDLSVEVSMQDEKKTMKIFITRNK